jgi:hypothetical protein
MLPQRAHCGFVASSVSALTATNLARFQTAAAGTPAGAAVCQTAVATGMLFILESGMLHIQPKARPTAHTCRCQMPNCFVQVRHSGRSGERFEAEPAGMASPLLFNAVLFMLLFPPARQQALSSGVLQQRCTILALIGATSVYATKDWLRHVVIAASLLGTSSST